jgi:hypothetical protein
MLHAFVPDASHVLDVDIELPASVFTSAEFVVKSLQFPLPDTTPPVEHPVVYLFPVLRTPAAMRLFVKNPDNMLSQLDAMTVPVGPWTAAKG